MENVRGAAWTITFGEARDCAVVQKLDPLDGSVDAVAVADGEVGEAFVFFIPRRYFFPGFFLEVLQPLMEVSNGCRVLLLLLVMDSIPLSDGLYEGFGDTVEPNWVVDVEPLNDVSSGSGRDGFDIGDRHEDRCRSARGAIRGHGDVSVWGAEGKGVGQVGT